MMHIMDGWKWTCHPCNPDENVGMIFSVIPDIKDCSTSQRIHVVPCMMDDTSNYNFEVGDESFVASMIRTEVNYVEFL